MLFSKLATIAIATIAMGVTVSATDSCSTGPVQCCTYCLLFCCQCWFTKTCLGQFSGTANSGAATLLSTLLLSPVLPTSVLGFLCSPLTVLSPTWYLISFAAACPVHRWLTLPFLYCSSATSLCCSNNSLSKLSHVDSNFICVLNHLETTGALVAVNCVSVTL